MSPDTIIKQFELYVDDLTELSTQEEYQLLNKVLQNIYNDRSWEFLRKTATVTTTTTNSALLPTDFVSPMVNFLGYYWDNLPEKTVAYVDSVPYSFIPRGSAEQLKGNYCYIDIINQTINFTTSVGQGKVVKFDYKFRPVEILVNTDVIALPQEFRRYLPQIMAVDDDIIQKTEKGRSNIGVNILAQKQLFRDLAHYDLRFKNY